jgi:hypothetical protein
VQRLSFLAFALLRIFISMSTISYREMIKLLEAADHETGKNTVSLVYLDCNRNKRKGGNWIKVENVKKCGLPYHCADHEMRGLVDENGKKTAFHLRLAFEINNMTVCP